MREYKGCILSAETKEQILHWFANGNVGISSKCIAKTALGMKLTGIDRWTPSDPSDFCRCLKLLRDAPELRAYLIDMMPPVSPAWDRLMDHWDEIEECFMSEVPGWMDGKDAHVSATRTYNLMRECAKIQP